MEREKLEWIAFTFNDFLVILDMYYSGLFHIQLIQILLYLLLANQSYYHVIAEPAIK